MARVLNVEIPNEKRIIISLTYVYGIGKSLAKKILDEANVNENVVTKNLSDEQLKKIREVIKKYQCEGDLRREIGLNIKRLVEIKSYRGIRHRRGLPVRGQVTQKNARTRKGPRKTVAGKRGK